MPSPQYFVDYKLSSSNETHVDLTPYRESFLSYLGFFAMLPNLLLQISNLLFQSKASVAMSLVQSPSPHPLFFGNRDGGIRKRITTAMIVQAIVLVVTVTLAALDSSSWPIAFFYITMVCVVILNMAAGIYQNLSWATAADLPMR